MPAHGELSPGGSPGNRNALKHGLYRREMAEMRKAAAELRREWRETEKAIG